MTQPTYPQPTQPSQRAYTPPAPPAKPKRRDWLDKDFTKFLSLTIIKIWWIVALITIALFTVGTLIGGTLLYSQSGEFNDLLVAVAAIPVGLLLAVLTRLFLEGVAVLFRIADNTAAIAGKQWSRGASDGVKVNL
jgi:Domain of unknown function (DUF4282)